MKRFASIMVLCLAIVFQASPSMANVSVKVDLSQQKMRVYVGGHLRYVWAVSSGRKGYRTPTGSYSPKRLVRMHYSRKYDMSPMPYSIFFRGGYAIHGTGAVGSLGRPASHGCIRLAPGNARALYNLVRARGSRSTRISITY